MDTPPSSHRPPVPPRRDRRLRSALLVGLLVALAGVVGLASPAGAHASLVSADPADGARVDEPPQAVTLTFTEPVSLGAGGVEVLDGSGEAVHEGDAVARDRNVTVEVQPDLAEGTYVISYRVTSADGHPVSGATTFGVGVEPEAGAADAAADDDDRWRWIAGAGRALSYLGLLLATGGAVFLTVVAAPDLPRRPFRWFVPAGAAAALLSVPLLVVSQAGRLSGAGWDVVTDGDVLSKALEQGLGWQALLTVVAAGLAVGSVRAPGSAALVLAEASVVAGAVALIVWGHARAADPAALAVVGDAFHLAAAAVWFGGLVLLTWTLLANVGSPEAAARTVGRFSALAGVVVLVLAAGGTALAVAEVGEVEALWDTTYGRLLLSKLAVVGLVLALAAWNRWRLVPAVEAGLAASASTGEAGEPGAAAAGTRAPSTALASEGSEVAASGSGSVLLADPPAGGERADEAFGRTRRAWSHLRRSLAWEVLGLVAVVGITTVLVETTPPGDEAAEAATPAGGPFDGRAPVGDATLSFQVTPGVAGVNQIHLSYIGPDGTLQDVAEEVTLELALPDADLGPIERQPDAITEGHLIYSGSDLSIPGTWEITVVSRVSRFEEERSTFEVPIGAG